MHVRHAVDSGLRLRPVYRVVSALLGLWCCWIAWRTVSAPEATALGGGARSLAALLAVVGVAAIALAFTGAGHHDASPSSRAREGDRPAAPPPA